MYACNNNSSRKIKVIKLNSHVVYLDFSKKEKGKRKMLDFTKLKLRIEWGKKKSIYIRVNYGVPTRNENSFNLI